MSDNPLPKWINGLLQTIPKWLLSDSHFLIFYPHPIYDILVRSSYNGNMAARVLIVGRHNLFHDAISHLLADNSSVVIVGTVSDWVEARQLMASEQPDILIIDHDTAELGEADLAPLLENEERDIKVIYLTLAQNKMIIHKRQQVVNVTATDLLQALTAPGQGSKSSVGNAE